MTAFVADFSAVFAHFLIEAVRFWTWLRTVLVTREHDTVENVSAVETQLVRTSRLFATSCQEQLDWYGTP